MKIPGFPRRLQESPVFRRQRKSLCFDASEKACASTPAKKPPVMWQHMRVYDLQYIDLNPQECPAPYANEGRLPAILKAPPSVRHWATPAAAMKAPPPVLRLSPSPPAVLRLSPAPPTTKAPPPEYVPNSDQARVVVYPQFVVVYPYTPVPQLQRNANTIHCDGPQPTGRTRSAEDEGAAPAVDEGAASDHEFFQ